jgi:hypothetical protein
MCKLITIDRDELMMKELKNPSQRRQLVEYSLISFNNSQSLKVINLNQLKRFRSQFMTFTINSHMMM